MNKARTDTWRIGLLATEVATLGGIQSFMQRIAEVIEHAVTAGDAKLGYVLSLNDTTSALSNLFETSSALECWGSARGKVRLLIRALFLQPRTDVVFVGHLSAGPVAHLMKRLRRTQRYFVVLHGIEAWKKVSGAERRALLGADAIIATTKFTAYQCAKENGIPSSRFVIVPLCVGMRESPSRPDFALNGTHKLLCVARLAASEKGKGIEHVFEAIFRLRAKYPGMHLNLVGDGDDRSRLRSVTREMGIADSVTFLGRLLDGDLAAAYEQCDLFVMPSRKEGFGIVFLEAMLRGKPCIGGRHGGTPEVIKNGETGYLIDYGDVSALTAAIELLARDSELRQRMGSAARRVAAEEFSFRSFESALNDLIGITNRDR